MALFREDTPPLVEDICVLLQDAADYDAFGELLAAIRTATGVAAVGFYRKGRGSYELEHALQPESETAATAPATAPGGRFFARNAPPKLEDVSDAHPLIDGDAELRPTIPRSTRYATADLHGQSSRPHLVTEFAGGLLVLGSFATAKAGRVALERWRKSAASLQRIAVAAQQRAQQSTEIQRLGARLKTTHRTIASALDMGALFSALLSVAARASRHEGAFVARASEAEGIVLRAQHGLDDTIGLEGRRLDGVLFDVDEVFGEHVVLPRDVHSLAAMGVDSLLVFPIVSGETLTGVLGLVNTKRSAGVDDADYDLLGSFTEQIAMVMDRELEVVAFGSTYFDTLRALCRALDLARGCEGHHDRVAELARDLAQARAFTPEQVALVYRAGLVHDVGLVQAAGGSRDVQTEFQHPVLGGLLAGPLRDGAQLAQVIREHHETDDGFGFPEALGAADLAPLGRTLAMAEYVVERMTGNEISEGLSPAAMRAELLDPTEERFASELCAAAADLVRGLRVA